MFNNTALEKLKTWFLERRRDFPWRKDPSPYRVWISEVMLQQTRAVVVTDYFNRWMKIFPSIEKLAKANFEEVIKLWEGLGYYSRVRNIHKAAQELQKNYQGQIPSKKELLATIPGIGPYTANAILSFAFHQPVIAIDGNVLRVITRLFAVEENISLAKTKQHIEDLSKQLIPTKEPWIIAEALIELGATLCNRTPKCQQCPLRKECLAYQQGIAKKLPIKPKKAAITSLYRSVAMINNGNQWLVKKQKPGKVMADLYEFPFIETNEHPLPLEDFSQKIGQKWNLNATAIASLPQVKHSFTRYQVYLSATLFDSKESPEIEGMQWLSLEEIKKKPFSSGHRQLVKTLFTAKGLQKSDSIKK